MASYELTNCLGSYDCEENGQMVAAGGNVGDGGGLSVRESVGAGWD